MLIHNTGLNRGFHLSFTWIVGICNCIMYILMLLSSFFYKTNRSTNFNWFIALRDFPTVYNILSFRILALERKLNVIRKSGKWFSFDWKVISSLLKKGKKKLKLGNSTAINYYYSLDEWKSYLWSIIIIKCYQNNRSFNEIQIYKYSHTIHGFR